MHSVFNLIIGIIFVCSFLATRAALLSQYEKDQRYITRNPFQFINLSLINVRIFHKTPTNIDIYLHIVPVKLKTEHPPLLAAIPRKMPVTSPYKARDTERTSAPFSYRRKTLQPRAWDHRTKPAAIDRFYISAAIRPNYA